MDDHPLFRTALRGVVNALSGATVAWEAASAEEAEALFASDQADLVLMDASLSGPRNGIDATRVIIRLNPTTRIVMISALLNEEQVAEAFAAGAVGFLPKDLPEDALVSSIRAVLAGRPGSLTRPNPPAAAPHGEIGARALSHREMEVLTEIAQGYTNREIALRLRISSTTVNKHVHNILQKLHARNRAQAALALQSMTDFHHRPPDT